MESLQITIFEPQVLRNYLLNGKARFLHDLRKNYQLSIVTNTALYPEITFWLTEFSALNFVEVVKIDKPKSQFFYRILQFFLKNINGSPSSVWSTGRNYALGEYSYLGMQMRRLLNRLLSKSEKIMRLLRLLLSFHHGISKKDSAVLLSLDPDLVLLTSATNNDWDARIGSMYNRKGIEVLSVPRSWDNLTSHGVLRYKPKQLFLFTQFMKSHVEKFHYLSGTTLVFSQNPAYQYIDLPKDSPSNLENVPRILYACTGEFMYRSEDLVFTALSRIYAQSSMSCKIIILQHPKFRTPTSIQASFDKFEWMWIEYNSFDDHCTQLYKLLFSVDFVLTAGSSIVLDAMFVGKEPVCLFFDREVLSTKDYWLDIGRYADYAQHFFEFLDTVKPNVFRQSSELETYLRDMGAANSITNPQRDKFILPSAPTIADCLIRRAIVLS